ncbi:MAG: 3-oxoacyl-ACP reductase family protein [Oscillospiraceae bacterium]|nr:3-oxoacyl-ACP reductase family protein [Oscillospiraceae bacterium]
MERKVAVVTGSSQGIGAATAIRLARDGFNIIVNCRIENKREAGDKVAAECETLGVKAKCVAADVSVPEQCELLVSAAVEFAGRIDVLVNNASIVIWSLLTRTTDEDFHKVMLNDAYSVFYMMRSVTPVMKKQHYGKIINISSVGGMYGSPGAISYGAAKGAVIAMTKSAAKELAISNITVNSIAPGATATEMSEEEMKCDARIKDQMRYVTMRRYARPEEIAAAASFLASDDSSYMTGHILEVSGGVLM